MHILRLRSLSLASTVLLVLGAAGIAHAVGQHAISKTQQAGPYSVTLKVLPPESFMGSTAEMAWDGAAKPVTLGAPANPNHHLVAFIEREEKPIENADVAIVYERKGSASGWQTLPVARMHVADKGPSTTHFGNNVKLEPGDYQARVTVNGKDSTTFEFTIPISSRPPRPVAKH
jgi:hypothetical protein